jgi:hypothetical protein
MGFHDCGEDALITIAYQAQRTRQLQKEFNNGNKGIGAEMFRAEKDLDIILGAAQAIPPPREELEP